MSEQLSLDSKDYGAKTIKAASIPESGIVFKFTGVGEQETKFTVEDDDGNKTKLMYIIIGEMDGQEINILFNSIKLKKMVDDLIKLGGQKRNIRLSGRGLGVERLYSIKTV